MPSLTTPLAVSVLPVPAFLLSKLCAKFALSPGATLPVITGVADDPAVPSYVLLSVTALTLNARAVMSALALAVLLNV